MLNFNNAPYFDDFDKSKKFYRILYRPSYAVQGRELTQSQSINQEQIRKFGDHIFEDGAMVIPGQITFDREVSYQKMNSTYGSPPVDVDLTNFLGYTVIGASSGVEGKVVNASADDGTDPLTFFIKFKNSGTDQESIGFWDGEELYRKDDSQIRATVEGILSESAPTYDSNGKGSVTSIGAGTYYISGIFVDNDAQSIIVSKYTQSPTCNVGLRIYESIVTPEDDLSLTDNAQGSPNYAAPGAHRYKIDLKLEYVDVDDDISDDFIILQYLKLGEVTKEIRTSNYSELEKTFARRTYDESGDYTVNPFSIILKEHLRDEDDELYKEGTYFSPTGDNTKLVAEMGTGKSYVQGYEISKISNTNVVLDKARDYDTANNSITNFSLGNYIKISNVHNIPRIDEFGEVGLYETTATVGTNNGDLVGTAKVRAIKRFVDSAYLYLFDIEMVDTKLFEDNVKWVYDSNGNGTNNFTCEPTIEDTKLFLYKVDNNRLIFKMGNDNIKTLSVDGAGVDTNYLSTRAYFNTGIVSNTATLIAKDNEVFQQNTADYYVANVSDGTQVTAPTFNFTGSPTGKIVEIGNLTETVNIIAPVSKTVIAEKTKYLQETGSVIITIPNKKQNDRDYLNKADVVRVKNVYMSAGLATAPTINDIDIRERYQMDTGQRDNYYDVGSIILKNGQNAPTGQIMVTFDYFTHSDGDYFSVDSYNDITYEEIPVYVSSESGESYVLGDCFDFRPRLSDNRSNFIGTGGSIGEIPQVFTDIRADYEYYLNRIDYLYVDTTGQFKISRGIPAIYPKPPEKPETGMVIYELYVNSYTFKPSDVNPTFKNNRRYTMRDIGDLDRRIGNLEYYTALSLLERETASMEILDQNGLNRFKNGFIVDPFDSHKVGDSTHSDYNCSIDPKNRKMRPKFNDENLGLLYDEINSSNVQRTGGVITLPYSEEAINKQNKASKYENINPFAFRNIFGKLVFNPNSDVWHDKETLPTLVVNNSPNYDALKFIADNTGDLNGVEWGRWEDVGGRKNISSSSSSKTTSNTISRQNTGISHDEGWLQRQTTTSFKSTTTWQQEQLREGVATTNIDSNVISDSLGDRITELNYIPYMRSIPVLIKSEQLKKNTKLYPFFDGVSMSSRCSPPSKNEYCTPASKINCSSISGIFRTDAYAEEDIKGQTSGATAVVVFQTNGYISVVNIKGTFTVGETVKGIRTGASGVVSSVEISSLGDPIISGDNGEVAFVWTIPNDSALKFMTGEREFSITDQISNADPVHTYAKGSFKTHGLSSKQEDTVLSTKTITFDKEPVRQSRTENRSTSTSGSKSSVSGWFDPIAQSFMINEAGGCFLTKLDIWFQSKDTEEAVICEIRNMVNGYPAEIAMAETTLQPERVNISEASPGTATTFTFSEPVYLKENADYCFVLKPAVSSASYQVWVSENGRIDIGTGEIITGKESLGSLFKSQNASTWTPNQNEDIMFTLYKAKFVTDTDGTVRLVNDNIGADVLSNNPLETYQGTETIRVYHNDHGLTVGSVYNISGLVTGTDYNGFLGSQINGEHTLVDIEIDSFTFIISGTQATASGLTGGEGIQGTRNYQLDLVHPIVNELIINETDVNWTLQTTTGTSISGAQTPYTLEPFVDVINNEDYYMSKPMVVASKYNEDTHLSGGKSLKMIGTLSSDNENVSPVIDASIYNSTTDKDNDTYFQQSSSTFIAVSNRIDEPSTTIWSIGASVVFSVGNGEDELVIAHTDHEMGTGSFILIENFTDTITGTSNFIPNGLHEIRVIDKDSYLIDMKETSTGYSGSGGGTTTLSYSLTHFKYVPESFSYSCSTASRYITKQVTLQDPAENFKIFFGAVREQYANIDVYYKTRSPYEVNEWNSIDWIRIDTTDEDVAISQSLDDFKDYSYTIEDIEPFNSIAIKLVMTSTDSTQVPIFTDFRLICTT